MAEIVRLQTTKTAQRFSRTRPGEPESTTTETVIVRSIRSDRLDVSVLQDLVAALNVPTDEMVTAAAEAIEDEAMIRIGRDLGTIHRNDIVRAGLVAALAIVERDIPIPPPRLIKEIGAARRDLPPGVDQRLRAALWTCSTYSVGDLHDALRAAGFVHVDELAAPDTATNAAGGRRG